VKRCNQYLLLGCLAAWLCGGNAWADYTYTLSLTPSSGFTLTGVDPGDTLHLDLNLRFDDPAILGITFDVAFTDADLAYVGYSNVASFSDWAVTLTPGGSLSPATYSSNPDSVPTYATVGPYRLATLEFTILGTTTATSTSLSFANINIWSDTLNDYMPLGSALDTTITINQPSPVPVPSTILLLSTGLAGLAAMGRRRHGVVA